MIISSSWRYLQHFFLTWLKLSMSFCASSLHTCSFRYLRLAGRQKAWTSHQEWHVDSRSVSSLRSEASSPKSVAALKQYLVWLSQLLLLFFLHGLCSMLKWFLRNSLWLTQSGYFMRLCVPAVVPAVDHFRVCVLYEHFSSFLIRDRKQNTSRHNLILNSFLANTYRHPPQPLNNNNNII